MVLVLNFLVDTRKNVRVKQKIRVYLGFGLMAATNERFVCYCRMSASS